MEKDLLKFVWKFQKNNGSFTVNDVQLERYQIAFLMVTNLVMPVGYRNGSMLFQLTDKAMRDIYEEQKLAIQP